MAGPGRQRRGGRRRTVGASRPGRSLPVLSVLALSLFLLAGCGPTKANLRTGALPGFLPRLSRQPDSVLAGSVARPAITSEGDGVEVRLAGGSVLVKVTGPEVPGEGLPYQARATTCTWTVTLTGATRRVRITVGDFTTLDHVGAVYHPRPVPGQPALPPSIGPGQTVTFELRAVMLTGEGLMRWAPDGVHIVAKWDFEVEND
jgi:hypothetical protein